MNKLLEMKLSRLKVILENADNAQSLIESVERALDGTGSPDLDSRYIHIADQFYKVVRENENKGVSIPM